MNVILHTRKSILPGKHCAKFNLQGEIDYATNEAWYYIESSLQLTLPYERNDLYVEVYPLDISFNDPFIKFSFGFLLNRVLMTKIK